MEAAKDTMGVYTLLLAVYSATGFIPAVRRRAHQRRPGSYVVLYGIFAWGWFILDTASRAGLPIRVWDAFVCFCWFWMLRDWWRRRPKKPAARLAGYKARALLAKIGVVPNGG